MLEVCLPTAILRFGNGDGFGRYDAEEICVSYLLNL